MKTNIVSKIQLAMGLAHGIPNATFWQSEYSTHVYLFYFIFLATCDTISSNLKVAQIESAESRGKKKRKTRDLET